MDMGGEAGIGKSMHIYRGGEIELGTTYRLFVGNGPRRNKFCYLSNHSSISHLLRVLKKPVDQDKGDKAKFGKYWYS